MRINESLDTVYTHTHTSIFIRNYKKILVKSNRKSIVIWDEKIEAMYKYA